MTPSCDDALKLIILDLISPARPGHATRPAHRLTQPQIDSLTDADWTEILRMARQHRIGPMMRWQLQHAHPHIRVPQRVADALTKQHKNWTARAMAMQRELLRVHGILEAASIPHVFLKGTYLAYCVYPHPALRPLRDLDILVPPDREHVARQALIAAGIRESPHHAYVPDEFQDTTQHQQPLLAGTVMLELHRRLFHLEHGHAPGQDLTDDPAFWSRCVRANIAGTPVLVPSHTDQLIHLMVHGVQDHYLSSGPLLLSDLALLARAPEIDWPTVRHTVARLGLERIASLALALVHTYCGSTPLAQIAEGHAHEVPADVMARAVPLMLCNRHPGMDTRVLRDLQSARSPLGKISVLWRAACPPRITLAMAFQTDPHSPWIWTRYPAWWWRHISRRLGSLARGQGVQLARLDAAGFAQLQDWLNARPAQPPARRANR